jgi:hypothetical protein
MSLINTDPIWLALGDFYHMFPDEERVYWDTFWEAYSDIVADLWGYAFQVDRGKSLFSTTPTFERREVLVKLSNLVEGVNAQFRISSMKQDVGGRWILRGFVPRDSRTFKAADLPDKGVIRIGVDVIPYSQVNSTTVVGGVYDGFVRESTFVLASDPSHDYQDDPDFNDDFANQPQQLKFRINQVAGETIVDTVLLNVNEPVVVNPTGKLTLGVPGINAEVVEYTSVTVIGDRYVFTLAPSWRPPASGPQELDFAHFVDELVTVSRLDPTRWIQLNSGYSRWIGDGSARLTIDQLPAPTAALGQLLGQYGLQSNVDFDVSVVVSLDVWDEPVPLTTGKRAYARINIGPQSYTVGVEKRRNGAGDIENLTIAGVEGAETEAVLATASDAFEARFKRVGGALELQFRDLESDSFRVLARETVSGARASLDLVVSDPNTQSPSSVVFDEVIRRAGGVIGNVRLEEFFTATDVFPYVYEIDQNLTSASELRDRPRTRIEFLQTIEVIEEQDVGVVRAVAAEDVDFEANGVPEAGVLSLDGKRVVYDSFVKDGDVFEFNVRGLLDPDILPLASDTIFTAETAVLQSDIGFSLSGDGRISLAELPTRDRMWAPVAQVDERHVQKSYGVLTDLDSAISTQGYLNRVQGTWFALMSGPSIRNVESGLQLAMGLPVARVTGTVSAINQVFDNLGRVSRYYMTILSEEGAVEHDLNPDLLPFIDWTVIVGQTVDQFQPLTNGIEVLDVVKDNEWHLRFPGVNDIERFNNFGVFVAIEALSSEASVNDALRFALRIKPTYTKMIMRFLLTSGNEDLSEDLDEDVFVAHVPEICEDITFPEGDPPTDPFATLRLGEGHKLGQAKKLGPAGYWRTLTLGTYARQGPFYDALDIVAASDVVTGKGGFSGVEVDVVADGVSVQGNNIFTTSGAHIFSAGDVGKTVVILDSLEPLDNGAYEIIEWLNASQVRLSHTFFGDAPALDWRLRSNIFTADDLGKNVHVINATDPADNGDHKIVEIVADNQVRVLHVFANTETDLDWEMRDYHQLGEGHELGIYDSFVCGVGSENVPDELVDTEQIVNVALAP